MRPDLRVLVAVPAEVERAGLCLMVKDAGHHVVAEAANGHSALALAQEFEPDVAILDATIPDVPALGVVHFLSQKCPGLQVLLFTEKCTMEWIHVALREGVRAFVLKRRVGKHLAPALRALSDRRPYWEEAVNDDVLDELLECGPRPPTMGLTSREWQVLQMAAEERSTKEMARTIGIAPRTIEFYRRMLRRKMGFRSKADLARYVAQGGRLSG
jgi:DNA-binding NarL/FixJ family response regulator